MKPPPAERRAAVTTPRPLRATPIVALDRPDAASAMVVVTQLAELCSFYKVGSELFTAEGPPIVRELSAQGRRVFLDLKYHDIPNTVRAACRSAAALGARLVTVHAAGGQAMMEAAVEGARAGRRDRDAKLGVGAPRVEQGSATEPCDVFAVTVLTSLDAEGLAAAWGRRSAEVTDEVMRLAGLAKQAGVAGIVCGAAEAAAVRAVCGPELQLLVPGLRLAGSAADDQKRVATVAEAAAAGADYVVVGRTVTGAASVRDAMVRVVAELA